MHPFRRVAIRLSVALAVVVAGALGLVWIALVPTLQRRLINAKERQLTSVANTLDAQALSVVRVGPEFVREVARTAHARVVYFEPIVGGARTTLLPLYGSAHLAHSADVAHDPVALRAASQHSVERGQVTRRGQPYVEVAVTDRSGRVLLLSASLHDVLDDARLVRSRLLWAGLLALGLAVLVGSGGATVFGARIRRLERATDRIAAGDFTQPVLDQSSDELGQLAAAFDRMRLQLAQLDDARRSFIANASHELRTPIFSLSGFIELLREDNLDDPTQAEFLSTMAEQVSRLSKLVTDLLDLSRLDAGALHPAREPVRLGEVARDLADEFAARALRCDHPLEVAVESDGMAVADRERVLQIGRALLDNALLHTPEGTRVRVVVRGTALAVEDDGPGIPAGLHEQVFTRFMRIEGTKSSGTGLGLAIARELAERMDGTLVLQSSPGRTAFVVRLPAAATAPEPPAPALSLT